jgi:hypothetical protein
MTGGGRRPKIKTSFITDTWGCIVDMECFYWERY